jgi:hypothetical protein
MGEAKRRKEVVEDLGKRILRCPDLSMWGTPKGLAESTGCPVSDPRIIVGALAAAPARTLGGAAA